MYERLRTDDQNALNYTTAFLVRRIFLGVVLSAPNGHFISQIFWI